MTRILACGSRTWRNQSIIKAYLEDLYSIGSTLAHGAAKGADEIAGRIANELGYVVLEYPVDTKIDGQWPAAGHRRNRRMFDDYRPEIVLAFRMPGVSNGTDGMTKYALSKGCVVWEIDRSGSWLQL